MRRIELIIIAALAATFAFGAFEIIPRTAVRDRANVIVDFRR